MFFFFFLVAFGSVSVLAFTAFFDVLLLDIEALCVCGSFQFGNNNTQRHTEKQRRTETDTDKHRDREIETRVSTSDFNSRHQAEGSVFLLCDLFLFFRCRLRYRRTSTMRFGFTVLRYGSPPPPPRLWSGG